MYNYAKVRGCALAAKQGARHAPLYVQLHWRIHRVGVRQLSGEQRNAPPKDCIYSTGRETIKLLLVVEAKARENERQG